MSDQQSNPSTIRNITINSPVDLIATGQPMGAQLSDIPVFFLGPSLYDYVRTFEDATSSIGSSSPPGTPPPNPIQIDQHRNGTSLSTAQVPIGTSDGEQIQPGSRAGNGNHTSSFHMLHTDRSSTSAPSSSSEDSESRQVPTMAPITAATGDSIESNIMNTHILPHESIAKSTVICTSNSNCNHGQAVHNTKHKCTGPKIETEKDPFSDRTDKGNSS